MKQLFQDMQAGKIEIVDIPEPAPMAGHIIVRNSFSVISPGTERLMVEAARSSYLKTARDRPDLVKRVVDTVKREGVLATYRIVRSKLSEPLALGYSSAGVVQSVGPGIGGMFEVGDRVACAGGGYASHAEVVSIPRNLAARVPDGVPMDSAAFSTIGAIAMHGVRQGEPQLGEKWGVIGLGIIGLFAVQILRAGGVSVAAFDLRQDLVDHARNLGAEVATTGGTDDQVQAALAWTRGLGLDGVLVTAASKSDAPMVSAAGMCRDRGRVVAVGFVPFGLPREIAYAKELDLRISRSYGPGRYDPEFEEKGVDYPLPYVRWTETRNLESFLELMRDGRVSLDGLISHRMNISDAAEGYDALVSGEGEPPVGMVIGYPESESLHEGSGKTGEVKVTKPESSRTGDVGVGFIGAGSFAKAILLPRFKDAPGVTLRRVATTKGLSAHNAQQRFGFEEIGTDPAEIFNDQAVNLVCIATRHDLHAEMVVRALRSGKHVFVEKPLALTEEQLREVEKAEAESPGLLLVGFNRRFSPMAVAIREKVSSRGPLMMSYRVNAGALPPGHWLNDPEVGGGRLIGEGCHFIDLLSFMTGDAEIKTVEIRASGAGRKPAEDFCVQVAFADDSVGQLVYTARGDASLGKERMEVHAGGVSAIIDDYAKGKIFSAGKSASLKKGGKGHSEEISALLEAVRKGGPSPISVEALARVTRATFGDAQEGS